VVRHRRRLPWRQMSVEDDGNGPNDPPTDLQDIAACSLFLAGKVEETPKKVRDVVMCCASEATGAAPEENSKVCVGVQARPGLLQGGVRGGVLFGWTAGANFIQFYCRSSTSCGTGCCGRSACFSRRSALT
jgi:hypothetical protein